MVSTDGVAGVQALSGLTSLRGLYFSGTAVTDAGVQALCMSGLTSLNVHYY